MEKSYSQMSDISRGSPKKKKVTPLGVLIAIIKYSIILILSVSFILPLYWMAMSALKIPEQVFTIPPIWFPVPARWINYIEAWQVDDFTLYLLIQFLDIVYR